MWASSLWADRSLDLGTGALKKQSSQDKPTSGIVRRTVSSLTSLLASLSHWYYGRPLDSGGSLRQEGALIRFPYLWEVPEVWKASSVTRYPGQGQAVPLWHSLPQADAQSRSQFLGNNSAENGG